jgi:dolichol-phosphate mannosyltransferase
MTTSVGCKPLVSVCIPVLNEELCIEALYIRLSKLADKMSSKCEVEFIFTDNHSSDRTWDLIGNLAKKDSRVKAIRFTKNIGFQKSIMANYLHSSGDAVFQIDADMQDPPELLEQFFDLWASGYKIVYGVRRSRPENIFLTAFRKVGYFIVDKMSDYPIPRNVGDFRLIDKEVVNTIFKYKIPTPYLRGLVAGLGFKSICIEFDRDKREAGTTKFKVSHLIGLGISAIFNNSVAPLRAASYVGLLMLAISIVGAFYYVAVRFMHPELPAGFASIHVLVIFGIGLNSFLLGILGEYLLRIYLTIRSDPLAIIEDKLNIAEGKLLL